MFFERRQIQYGEHRFIDLGFIVMHGRALPWIKVAIVMRPTPRNRDPTHEGMQRDVQRYRLTLALTGAE